MLTPFINEKKYIYFQLTQLFNNKISGQIISPFPAGKTTKIDLRLNFK